MTTATLGVVPRLRGRQKAVRSGRTAARRVDVEGVVYLLHFERPYEHARHYIGWAEDLDARIAQHDAGTGANLVAVVVAAGINFEVARTWNGTRALERRKKNRGATAICPVCRGERPRIDHRDAAVQPRLKAGRRG